MLWNPGPNELLVIAIVWVTVTLGPGLLGIVYLIRRRCRKKAGEPVGRTEEPGRGASS